MSGDRFAELLSTGSVGDGLKANTVRGGAYAVAGEGVDFVLRITSVVVLARLIEPAHFGLISMVTAITSVAERFQDLGLANATIQSRVITHEQVSTLFWVNAAVGAMMMALVAALAYPISSFYREPRLVPIAVALATSFLWSGAANQHHALLKRAMRFRQIAIIQLAASAASIGLAIVLAVMGWGYWALVARELSRNALLAMGAWISFPLRPGTPTRNSGAGRMLRFGAHMTGSTVAYFLSSSLDQILVGRAFGAVQLGFYRQSLQLALAPMTQVQYPVRVVTESALSRLQSDRDTYRRYYRSIVAALAFPTIPLGLFMTVYAEELVVVVLGPAWAEAAPVFRILACAGFLAPAAATTSSVLVSFGHSRRFLWMGVLSSGILMLLLAFGVRFGPTGVACAHLVTFWLLLLPRLHLSFADTPVAPAVFWSAVRIPLGAGAFMVAALLVARWLGSVEASAVRLLAVGLVVGATTYIVGWLTLPGGQKELRAMLLSLSEPLGLSRMIPRWLA